MDGVEQGERAEASIDAFIEKRSEQRVKDEGERRTLEEWQVTERIHEARKRRARAEDWYYWHLERAEGVESTGAAIAASHRVKAARILRTELDGKLSLELSENGHDKEI